MRDDPDRASYDHWHKSLALHENDRLHLAPWHEIVLRKMGYPKSWRVLEVGCGRGDFAITLAQRGAEVTACDFSPAAIEIAKQRAAAYGVHVDFRVEDAQEIHLKGVHYDVVISCETLEHVPQPELMLAELYRLCATDGRCLITTESYLNGMLIAWAYSKILGRPFNSGCGAQPHENFFFYFIVASMIRRAGFRIMGLESWHFQFLLLPRCDPSRLSVSRFSSSFWNRFFRPFGRHFCFDLRKEG